MTDDYGYDDTPRQPSGGRSDHERVVTSGAWLGALLVCASLGWADQQIPVFCTWLMNTMVIMTVAYAMAAWKQVWYGWLANWGLAACCAADRIP